MATANFTFTTLTGTETAGWNSINSLITSIDTQLNTSNRLIYMSGWSAVAGQTIKWDAANSRWVPGTLDGAAFANNSVELGTKTTGNYVASIVAAGTNEVSVTGTGEGAAATVRLANNTALRGAATVETPPTYSGGSTGTVGRVPDAKYVTDALAYATSGNVTLGGDVTGNASANTIANNAVTDAKLRDSSGLSVIGRAANTTGDPADIIAGTDNHVLRRSGTSVGFGQVATDGIATSAITYPKLGDDVKRFSVASTATAGLYFTSTGNLTTASLARNATQQPLVVVNSSSAVDLYLPYNLGSVGDIITITSIGSGFTQIICLQDGPGGTGPSFYGSIVAEFTEVTGVIMLICISDNGSGPFGGTRDWLVLGDYLLD